MTLGPSCEELSLGEPYGIHGGQLYFLKKPGELLVLVLPEESLHIERISTDLESAAVSGTGKLINLVTGQIMPFDWHQSNFKSRICFKLDSALTCSVPMLLIFYEETEDLYHSFYLTIVDDAENPVAEI